MASTKSSPQDPKPMLRETAARWLMRMEAGPDEEEELEFELWLAECPKHLAAYTEAESMLGALKAPVAFHALPARSRRPRRKGNANWRLSPRMGIAAGIVFAVLALGWTQRDLPMILTADARTHAGDQASITLEDGSQVLLNTRTLVDIDFTDDLRLVRLQRGEAYFDVTRDVSRPFRISTSFGNVDVLGTAFNVRRLPDGLSVSVERGRVAVSSSRHGAFELEPGEGVVLVAGQEAQRVSGLGTVAPWRGHRAIYRNTPLRDVIDDLRRYRGPGVILIDKEIGEQPISAALDVSRPEASIEAAATAAGVSTKRLPGGLILIY